MSAKLKEAPKPDTDLTPERQLDHIQRLDKQCASLYELLTKLSERIDALEKSNEHK